MMGQKNKLIQLNDGSKKLYGQEACEWKRVMMGIKKLYGQ